MAKRKRKPGDRHVWSRLLGSRQVLAGDAIQLVGKVHTTNCHVNASGQIVVDADGRIFNVPGDAWKVICKVCCLLFRCIIVANYKLLHVCVETISEGVVVGRLFAQG